MTKLNEKATPKYEEIINEILHGRGENYYWLQKLQRAVEFKGKIPKWYIYADMYKYTEFFGIGETKEDARETRMELINEIIYVLLNQKETEYGEEMMPDNYSRLFHALAILKLEKDTNLLPGTTENFIYNCAYMLWRLDDGSEVAGKAIDNATWFMAEEIKGRIGMIKSDCLLGIKC